MKKQYKIQLPKGMVVKNDAHVEVTDDCIYVEVELVKEQKYEPKDGDFIVLGTGLIGIFKNTDKYWFNNYATLCGDCLTLFKEGWVGENIRPATEEEKNLLIDKLAEVGKRWNEEKKCLEDVRWRAKEGEMYFYLTHDVETLESCEVFDEDDDVRYEIGNYFKTIEAAKKVAEQLREIFKNSKSE